LPVRSAIYKQCTGGSVIAWVTSSESPLLYVFVFAMCGVVVQPWVKRSGLRAERGQALRDCPLFFSLGILYCNEYSSA
ncbi:hypothetical protein P171DRAFT_350458, partial [Karstenula rhodostoma CBS 690.94]